MGDYSLTCSVSGLGISGGTAVRCFLVTASPYGDEERNPWIVRTPPIRAEYNGMGTIEEVHPDDLFTANLWLRGLREDLIEKGLGDNSFHDVPARKDMSFEEFLDALRSDRLEVRQDSTDFWMRPTPPGANLPLAFAKRVEQAINAEYPGVTSTYAGQGKYVVDEPAPYMARVRFGRYEIGDHTETLERAKTAIEKAGFVGVITAGTGRYANRSDLLVFPAPSKTEHVTGTQWDMAAGEASDQNKRLKIALAMVREDVWQALLAYPHEDTVSKLCLVCGQCPWYHGKGRLCPSKSYGDPFKKHKKGTRYTPGPIFPENIEHHIVQTDSLDTVWCGLDAYKAGTHETWNGILAHFKRDKELSSKPRVERLVRSAAPAKTKAKRKKKDEIDIFIENLQKEHKKEQARIAALPAKEREKIEKEQKERDDAYDQEEKRRKENPFFGDFLIRDHIIGYPMRPGAWIFRDSVPGVIGLADHLSMCMADKVEVPSHVIDSIAELSAVRNSLNWVGVQWKPALSTGPQFPEWAHHVRFANTIARVATNIMKERNDDKIFVPSTLNEARLLSVTTPEPAPEPKKTKRRARK